jgi:uroporphyrinogen decarboxylase
MTNDLFLKALGGEAVDRPPVWIMRQAGRYLPDFMKLKAKYDFFTRCRTPELATEITVMPIDQIGTDAAILFSDILVLPQAMGLPFEMKPGTGPFLSKPVRSANDVDRLMVADVEEELGYVMDAIRMTKAELKGRVPLIGFAGSPWTIFCYSVEGQGSKTFNIAKEFAFTNPIAAHLMLQKITESTIAYLRAQIKNGVDVVQVFDSWGGVLSPTDFETFSGQYIRQIVDALKEAAPVIVFAKGCWHALSELSKSGASALGVDWTIRPEMARQLAGRDITLQGNFDPARLYSSPEVIQTMVWDMIDAFGKDRYVVNLGHGILPDIPVDHVRAFVGAVKSYSPKS